MPLYEYKCSTHGRFDVIRLMEQSSNVAYCPACGTIGQRLFSVSAIKFVHHERQAFGSGSPGRMLTHDETGGLDVFIPSYGVMEQDEVDYIAEGAIEKEQARVKSKTQRETQARIQSYTDLAHSAPQGQRAKTVKAAIAESGDKLVK